jgi:hypothetical protein
LASVAKPRTPHRDNFVVEMSLTNVDGIRSREMVRLLIDFLTESRAGLVSLRSSRKMRAINETVNVLDLTFSNE